MEQDQSYQINRVFTVQMIFGDVWMSGKARMKGWRTLWRTGLGATVDDNFTQKLLYSTPGIACHFHQTSDLKLQEIPNSYLIRCLNESI